VPPLTSKWGGLGPLGPPSSYAPVGGHSLYRLTSHAHGFLSCRAFSGHRFCRNYGFFAPLPFRPLARSRPGLFAPARGIIAIRRQKLYAYNLLFIFFQGFLFRLRLYKERQLYNSIIKASIFRQIRKLKSIFYYLHSMCNRKYTFLTISKF